MLICAYTGTWSLLLFCSFAVHYTVRRRVGFWSGLIEVVILATNIQNVLNYVYCARQLTRDNYTFSWSTLDEHIILWWYGEKKIENIFWVGNEKERRWRENEWCAVWGGKRRQIDHQRKYYSKKKKRKKKKLLKRNYFVFPFNCHVKKQFSAMRCDVYSRRVYRYGIVCSMLIL